MTATPKPMTISQQPIFFVAACPRCGHEQRIVADRPRSIELCDPEDGGCDQYFALRWWVEPRWETAIVDFPSMQPAPEPEPEPEIEESPEEGSSEPEDTLPVSDNEERVLAYLKEHMDATEPRIAEGLDLPVTAVAAILGALEQRGRVLHNHGHPRRWWVKPAQSPNGHVEPEAIESDPELTDREQETLHYIRIHGGCTQRDIAERLGVTVGAISIYVRTLEEHGLVVNDGGRPMRYRFNKKDGAR